MNHPVRLAPEIALPPYAYIPGTGLPHPTSDPRGHSFGKAHTVVAEPLPQDWTTCKPYLYGIDLFNYGYYWEAHESWESIWKVCQREGTAARFLKGLIKLAAAGVKMREGRAEGVISHSRRAAELFRSVAADSPIFMGLSLSDLIAAANSIGRNELASIQLSPNIPRN